MIRRASLRIGRRGALLIVLGVIWALLGFATLLNPIPEGQEHLPHVVYLPVWLRVGLWWGTAAVAIAHAFVRPRGTDWPGFVALYVMPAERVVSFTVGWMFLDYSPGWLGALAYSAIVALLLITSGWPEPTPEGV